jgi:hypothetical protein
MSRKMKSARRMRFPDNGIFSERQDVGLYRREGQLTQSCSCQLRDLFGNGWADFE